jgi:hypothetical protein
MKRSFLLFCFCLFLASCASVSPVGSWNYTVTGTPNGDYAGTLIVTKIKKQYAATLNSQGGDLPFKKFAFDPKTKKATGDFDYQGTPISLDAAVKENDMAGTLSTDDAQFPFKAARGKEVSGKQ